jgi:transcriptional regulator GlxA family with amidase domain
MTMSAERLSQVERLLISTDLTVGQIGERLGISRHSARNYITLVYHRHGVYGPNPKRHVLVRNYYLFRNPDLT